MSGLGKVHDLPAVAALAASYPLQARIPFDERLLQRSSRRHLRAAAFHAYEHVPLYRERFDAAGVRPEEIVEPADLARLPILERELLHEEPERLISDLHPRESLIESRTSGSSGMPIRFFIERDAMFRGARIRSRRTAVRKALTGRRFGHRDLRFGNPDPGGRKRREAFGEVAFVGRFRPRYAGPPTSAHMPLDDAVAAIAEQRAQVLGGFGSYLEAIFAHAFERGQKLDSVELASFGGDGMTAAGRTLIEREFGVPVRSQYASIEAPLIGFECEVGEGFHLNLDALPLRIVDESGSDVEPGESGEVVVSNLISRGTVLLNYRLGDRARMLPGSCPCGRVMPRLGPIEGRIYDWLVGRDGERVHPEALGSGFRHLPAVRMFQIVQRARQEFVIRVMGEEVDPAGLAATLTPTFRELFGDPVSVSVERVARIEPESSGKVRRVLCELEPGEAPIQAQRDL